MILPSCRGATARGKRGRAKESEAKKRGTFGEGGRQWRGIQVATTLLGLGSIRHVGRNPGVPSGAPRSPKAAFIPAKSGQQVHAGLQLRTEAHEPCALGRGGRAGCCRRWEPKSRGGAARPQPAASDSPAEWSYVRHVSHPSSFDCTFSSFLLPSHLLSLFFFFFAFCFSCGVLRFRLHPRSAWGCMFPLIHFRPLQFIAFKLESLPPAQATCFPSSLVSHFA